MNKPARQLAEKALEVAGTLTTTADQRAHLAALAREVLGAKRRPRKVLAPGRTKAQRDAALREETARIRAYVDRRDTECVICLTPAPEPWEMHHIDSGTGKAQRQTVRNCAKAHDGCHKRAHRGDLEALRALLRWARAYGYGETETVIERRIAKIHEARRSTP